MISVKGLSDQTPSLTQCPQYMSFLTLPDYNNTIGTGSYGQFVYFYYMKITDTTLTCSVKKWDIVTNYPN